MPYYGNVYARPLFHENLRSVFLYPSFFIDLDEGIDEYNEEGEGADSIIDSIKREFEDEGEGF